MCQRSTFLNNRVALEIAVMPKGCWLEPNGCEFRGNGENVVNPYGYRVDMVDCTVS